MGCGGSTATPEKKDKKYEEPAAKSAATKSAAKDGPEESPMGGKSKKKKKSRVPVIMTVILVSNNKETPFGVNILSSKLKVTDMDDGGSSIGGGKGKGEGKKEEEEPAGESPRKSDAEGRADSCEEERRRTLSTVKTRTLRDFTITTLGGHKGRVKMSRISHDGSGLISCGSEDKVFVCTELFSKTRVLNFKGHDDVIVDACFSSDHKTIVTVSRDNTCITWDALTAKKQNSFDCQSLVIFVRMSPDGKGILMGFQDCRAVIHDTKTGTEGVVFEQHSAIVSAGNYSPDGKWVVTGSVNGQCFVWAAATGVERYAIDGGASNPLLNCQFSSDMTAILTHSDIFVHVWDVRTGEQRMNINLENKVTIHEAGVEGLTSPKNKAPRTKDSLRNLVCVFVANNFILVGRNDRKLQLLDPNTGKEVLMMGVRSHINTAHSADAIFPSGSFPSAVAPPPQGDGSLGHGSVGLPSGDRSNASVIIGDVNGNVYLLNLVF